MEQPDSDDAEQLAELAALLGTSLILRHVARIVLLVTVPVALVGCTATNASPGQPSLSPVISTVSPRDTATPSPSRSASPSSEPTPAPDTRKGKKLNQPYEVQGIPVISKKHRVSASYGPADPTGPNHLDAATAAALATMTAAAKADGVTVKVKSGYRSYATQKASYDRALRTQPQNINYYAPPGASEHQTGLAVDLWDGRVWYRAMENTATGKWLHKHAHEYGFILRFPQGKQTITGVPYEPWHFRYIGVSDAKKFGKGNTLTLEEYLGLN